MDLIHELWSWLRTPVPLGIILIAFFAYERWHQTVARVVEVMDSRLDSVVSDLEDLKRDTASGMESRVGIVDQRLKQFVESFEEQVLTINQRFDEHCESFEQHVLAIDEKVEAQQTAVDENLETRVAAVEDKIEAVDFSLSLVKRHLDYPSSIIKAK